MLKKLSAIAVTTLLINTGANAAILDFLTEGNEFERGESSGYVLQNANTGGLKVIINSSHNPYFDAGDAGLGVCKDVVATQCSPSSDDNVTAGEWVELEFEGPTNLSGFHFRGADHSVIDGNLTTVLISVNGAGDAAFTFSAAASAIFENVTSIRFTYGGESPQQFYISSAEAAVVPLPGSLPLLLGALGWLASRSRR